MTDLFRDTWVRYLGYANEVGESFRPVVPVRWVRASYGLAFAYVLADTADKTIQMIRKDGRPTKVLAATGDALVWQTLASIIIPGFTINRICAFTLSGLNHYKLTRKLSPRTRCFVTVGVGLASIPFIVHPIDKGVTMLMDNTYRKVFDT